MLKHERGLDATNAHQSSDPIMPPVQASDWACLCPSRSGMVITESWACQFVLFFSLVLFSFLEWPSCSFLHRVTSSVICWRRGAKCLSWATWNYWPWNWEHFSPLLFTIWEHFDLGVSFLTYKNWTNLLECGNVSIDPFIKYISHFAANHETVCNSTQKRKKRLFAILSK